MHDIGKMIERGACKKETDDSKRVKKGGHANFSAQLISDMAEKNVFFKQFSNDLEDTVLYHHEPKSPVQKIIQFSDRLSSSKNGIDIDSDSNDNVLDSIFKKIFEKDNGIENDFRYDLQKLNLNNIFPQRDINEITIKYGRMTKDLIKEIKALKNEKQLYYLLEKYLWSVPAETTGNSTDISLFDHLKTTAAISLCLYDQYKAGDLTESDLKEMDKNKKEQFLLINGDFSGIQNFIFNIPSKNASKSLKGRSVYLNLLSDIVVKYIITNLELKEANIIYNGGGNFYILAPLCKKETVEELRENIASILLATHQGEIYLALDYISFAPVDFNRFTELWYEVKTKVNRDKNSRWKEIDLENNFNKIFGPLDNGGSEYQHCHICGVSCDTRVLEEKDDKIICGICKSFSNLTEDLKLANYLKINKASKDNDFLTYNDIFSAFGYRIGFSKEWEESDEIFLLNSTDFLAENCTGFKFAAYNLPAIDNKQLTFEQLSEKSIENNLGDKKLGILKLDVDNLGTVFTKGLEENRSIARITTLSRMMGLFFEGYINKIIEDNFWQEQIYVVFSGGDDTFIVGSWNVILDFTEKFYEKFREYTCHNKYITFSVGLGIFRYNYPINRAADLTEEYLDMAKEVELEYSQNIVPLKNKITFWGETFNWQEFKRIKNIKDILYNLVVEKGYGHSLLHKVNKSTLGFKKILKDSNEGLFENIRFWRLAYYLREVKSKDKAAAEKLIQEYREIVIHNLTERSEEKMINNIMIIPAAVRWAEMATRKYKED